MPRRLRVPRPGPGRGGRGSPALPAAVARDEGRSCRTTCRSPGGGAGPACMDRGTVGTARVLARYSALRPMRRAFLQVPGRTVSMPLTSPVVGETAVAPALGVSGGVRTSGPFAARPYVARRVSRGAEASDEGRRGWSVSGFGTVRRQRPGEIRGQACAGSGEVPQFVERCPVRPASEARTVDQPDTALPPRPLDVTPAERPAVHHETERGGGPAPTPRARGRVLVGQRLGHRPEGHLQALPATVPCPYADTVRSFRRRSTRQPSRRSIRDTARASPWVSSSAISSGV